MFVAFNRNEHYTCYCLIVTKFFALFLICSCPTFIHRETAPSKCGRQAQGVSSSGFHLSGQDSDLERGKQL